MTSLALALLPRAGAILRANWRYVGLGLIILALGVQSYRVNSWRSEARVALSTIKSMDAQAKAADKRYRAAEGQLQANATNIKKDADNEIASISAARDAALVELRSRPSRNAPAVTTTIAGTCKTPAGATGRELFREDSEFLTREAARADTVRIALKACYAQYDSARMMLSGE